MSADLLRRAAALVRESAEGATPGPWQHVDYADPEGQPLTSAGLRSTYMGCGEVQTVNDRLFGGSIAAPSGDCYPRSGYSPKEDMAYIALMHPPVALAVAAWLESAAGQAQFGEDHIIDFTVETELAEALAVARAILREPHS